MERLIDILPKTIHSLGVHKQYKMQSILFNWAKIVGGDIAAQSFPVAIEFGVLFLSVNNSVWCHHLSMMKHEIIHQVNQFAKDLIVKDVRFKNQSVKEFVKETEPEETEFDLGRRLRDVALTAEELREAERRCADVKEEKLKWRIFNLYKKHLRLNKLKREADWHPCAACGALCPKERTYCHVCGARERTKRIKSIRALLHEVPWATYAEINQYVPCVAEEYIDAKITLLNWYAGEMDKDNAGMSAKILTMLFTGAKHNELSERLIEKTVAKFRRKDYVSASRGRHGSRA